MTSSDRRAWLVAGTCAFIVAAAPAFADDAPAATPPPAAAAPSVDVTGFVDGFYAYNFNKPFSKTTKLHTFDADHNTFELSLAEVAFEKKPVTAAPVGFRIDLDFGTAAGIVGNTEPSGTSNRDVLKHVEQGYVSWLPDPKVQIDFGKFVTMHGAEVIESKDNWNYTRSVQFGFAIPFYHTGLRATINPSDKVTIGLHVVNGWNNVVDNNTAKTFGGQLVLKPSSKFSWTGNIMAGDEGTGDTRVLFDTIASLTASSKVSAMANFDYGKDGDNKWLAVSGYLRLQASSTVAFAPRVEYYDDQDGFTTGTIQKISTFTLTSEVKLGGDLLTRLDLRYDHSNVPFFDGKADGETKKGQATATVGVVYAFGGKI